MGIILAIVFGIYFGIGILLAASYVVWQIAFWWEAAVSDPIEGTIKEALGLLFIWPWRFK